MESILDKPEWNDSSKKFTHPQWELIAEWLEARHPEAEWSAAWCDVAREWAKAVSIEIGSAQHLFESEHFILSASAGKSRATDVLRFLESTFDKIVREIPFAHPEESLLGKCVVFIFSDTHQFYEYLSDFAEHDGESGLVGGVYINKGYGHFAMPSDDLSHYTDVLSHELSHAMVAHLALPVWLDEAIAMTVEDSVTHRNPYILDREIIQRHREYWDREKIMAFWKGESFWYADEGQELSYHLAQFLFSAVLSGGETSPDELHGFVESAEIRDAGFKAFRALFGHGLEDLLSEFLGPGDWTLPDDPIGSRTNGSDRGAELHDE